LLLLPSSAAAIVVVRTAHFKAINLWINWIVISWLNVNFLLPMACKISDHHQHQHRRSLRRHSHRNRIRILFMLLMGKGIFSHNDESKLCAII